MSPFDVRARAADGADVRLTTVETREKAHEKADNMNALGGHEKADNMNALGGSIAYYVVPVTEEEVAERAERARAAVETLRGDE